MGVNAHTQHDRTRSVAENRYPVAGRASLGETGKRAGGFRRDLLSTHNPNCAIFVFFTPRKRFGMRRERIQALSEIFRTGKRGAVIAAGKELICENESLKNLYSIALDVAYGPWKKRGTALRKLKDLAGVTK